MYRSERYAVKEPLCRHVAMTTRVSSHENLAALSPREPHASTMVCDREACIEDAKAWVWASTHREPVVTKR